MRLNEVAFRSTSSLRSQHAGSWTLIHGLRFGMLYLFACSGASVESLPLGQRQLRKKQTLPGAIHKDLSADNGLRAAFFSRLQNSPLAAASERHKGKRRHKSNSDEFDTLCEGVE